MTRAADIDEGVSIDERSESGGRDPAGSAGREGGCPLAIDSIEPLITELVRAAPASPPAVVDELIEQLHRVGTPLARTIARVVELVAEQLVDPGVALPALAMACATLADGVRGVLTERELEAARYEIDTLLPVPDLPPPLAAPDVPLSSLRRRP